MGAPSPAGRGQKIPFPSGRGARTQAIAPSIFPSIAPSISCVVPVYNEAGVVARVVADILAALVALSDRVELIAVDDGSRDGTYAELLALCAQHPQLVCLRLSRNFGKERALTAGIDAARGEVVVLMDGDGQHPTALLPVMFQQWRDGADVVYAVRQHRNDQSPLHARLTAWFYRLINLGSRVRIPPDAGDYRWMDRKVVDALKQLPERNRFMKGLYAWVGFQSVAIPYDPLPRSAGHSNFGLVSAFSLALTGMLAFSVTPLRVLTLAGLVLSCLALGYGAWVVAEYFLYGIAVPGFATIVVAIMFFSGVQLLATGILSEYVARIYEEVKRRPNYLIGERVGEGLDIKLPPPPVDLL
ncbi:glycosyltransferase family 2 protein [Candidatus Symbiobacter mobilis]|uniref:glycosyltransferase family 2 protein n=1 Tax=Candidatus Symbiobacter mobilis TaxID=1436290 RepID=UPI003B75B3D3